MMEHNDWTLRIEPGIAELSPEQTVTILRSFMNDEASWTAARKAGITIPQAEQCVMDLWNIFSWRKRIMTNA